MNYNSLHLIIKMMNFAFSCRTISIWNARSSKWRIKASPQLQRRLFNGNKWSLWCCYYLQPSCKWTFNSFQKLSRWHWLMGKLSDCQRNSIDGIEIGEKSVCYVVLKSGGLIHSLHYIIARLFRGMHWNCQSQGSHFSSQGAKPRGMKMTPEGLAISMHPEKWSCNSIST